MTDRLRIAIPLFPQFTALDAIGLRSAAAHPDLDEEMLIGDLTEDEDRLFIEAIMRA